jgi:large subunit ribosomal protein L25
VVKAVQAHPSKPRVLHIDFQRVSKTEKLVIKVPLHFMGQDVAPGVKDQGGVISHNMTELEIKCLPGDLPAAIKVDVSKMALDESLHLTDLTLPPNIELTAFTHGVEDHDYPVVSIHPPIVIRDEEEEVVEGEEGEEGAEGEGTEGEGGDDKGKAKEKSADKSDEGGSKG